MTIQDHLRAKRADRTLVAACRRLGGDVQQHVGLEAAAAALGFRRWNDLVHDPDGHGFRPWSDGRCRARVHELVPDVDGALLDGAIAELHARMGGVA